MAQRNVVFKFTAEAAQINGVLLELRQSIAQAQKILGNLKAKVDANQAKKDLAQLKSDLKVAEKERIIKLKADTKQAEASINQVNREAKQAEKERILKLKADDRDAKAKIRENEIKLKSLERERLLRIRLEDRDARQKLRDLQNEAKKTEGVFGEFGTTIKNSLLAFAGIQIGQELLSLTKNALEASISIEKIQVSYRTLIGDAEKANAVFEQIKAFAIETPFEVKELTDAGRILLQYGITAEDLTETLRRLGDITASGTASLGNVALAYGQIAAKGKLQGEEIRQLVNSGFNPLQEIARTTGETMESLAYRLEQGQISFEEVAEALRTATEEGGRFFEATLALSETLGGQLNKLRDNFFFLAVSIGDTLKPTALATVQSLITLTEKLKELPSIVSENKYQLIAITTAIAAYTVSVRVNSQTLFTNITTSIRKNVIDRITIAQTRALSVAERIKTAAMTQSNIVMRIATGVTTGLNIATKALWATIRANPLGALISVIGLGITAWQAYKDSKEKALDPSDVPIDTQQVARDLDNAITSRYKKEQLLLKLNTQALRDNINNVKEFNKELQKVGEQYGVQVGQVRTQLQARAELRRVENEILKAKKAQIEIEEIGTRIDPLLERQTFLEVGIKDESLSLIDKEKRLRNELQNIINKNFNASDSFLKNLNVGSNKFLDNLTKTNKELGKTNEQVSKLANNDVPKIDVTQSREEFEKFYNSLFSVNTPFLSIKSAIGLKFTEEDFATIEKIKKAYDDIYKNTNLVERRDELNKINALIEKLNVGLKKTPPPINEPLGAGKVKNYYKELADEAERLKKNLDDLIKPVKDFEASILPDTTEEQQIFKAQEIAENDIFWQNRATDRLKADWDQRVADAIAATKDLSVLAKIRKLDAEVQPIFEATKTRDRLLAEKKAREEQNQIQKDWDEKDLEVRNSYWDQLNELEMFNQQERVEGYEEAQDKLFELLSKAPIGRRSVQPIRDQLKDNLQGQLESITAIEKAEVDAAEEKRRRDFKDAKDNISDGIDFGRRFLQIESTFQEEKTKAEKKGSKARKEAGDAFDQKSAEAEKQRKLRIISDIETITNATIDGINRINDARIREAEIAIEAQEKRVERAKEIAEDGNAELYEIEKERLEKLQQERAKFVRQQQAIIVLQIAAESALAVARAAAEGGGVLSPILVAGVIATLVAGFAAAKVASAQSVEGFETGGYTGDGGKKDVAGVVHKGEFVFTKEQTSKNRRLFEEIHKGRDPFLAAGVGQQIIVMNNAGMEDRLSRIEKAIMEQSRLNLSIDESGIHGIVSHYQWKNQRIRNKAR